MIKDSHSFGNFLVYMGVAVLVFITVLIFIVRGRSHRPTFKILLLALICAVGGMIFARVTYGRGMPWYIFYGIPVFLTYILPPLVLQMSKRELLFFVPLALLMAPAIHIFFSFFFGWHDYMPLFYIPSWHELIG
jgi:hypothetical protein